MGRKKKYITDEELILARRMWSKAYYERNKSRIDLAQKEKYHKLKYGKEKSDL